LNIERGKAAPLQSGASPADALSSACSGPDYPPGSPINPAPVTNLKDISKNNYLDDRSGPVEVLSSLFNAINRKEYVRAYSYWEANSQVPPFDQFQNGYANTESVQFTSGQVSTDHGAGQIYYSVPVVLTAKTTSGAAQTYAGCYKFHLANPQIQATPPFIPLSIMSAQVTQVANDADVQTLLSQACQ
jgi:hypothetical protein